MKDILQQWLAQRTQVPGVLACGSLGRQYFRRYGVPDDRIYYTPYEPDYAMIASVTSREIAEA